MLNYAARVTFVEQITNSPQKQRQTRCDAEFILLLTNLLQ